MNERPYDGALAEQAYHELGHFFAHTAFGHRVDSIEVGENFGCCTLPAQDIDDAYSFIIALCGGKAAIDKWYGYKTPNDEAWRKSNDHGKAYAVALRVSRGDHTAASLLMKWAERMADSLIEAHWHKLHEPARMLAEKGKLTVVR
jgi:hypothetical protein